MRNAPYLNVFRVQFGRCRCISRKELAGLLIHLATEVDLDLRSYAGWYGARQEDNLETIGRAVANVVQGMTVLSLGGHVRDIQHDEPGSMDPLQYAQISFVSEELARGDYDYDRENHPGSTMAYLRYHAERVVIVTGEALPDPNAPEPKPDYFEVRCDAGHRWRIPRTDDYPQELDRCPVCGDYWQ